ncbi:MAG: hypothetical protein JWR38_2269 [Mucilaginibacter sp.]|nr:hypothetical protein [Mucilaginibacter sp.]
MNNGTLNNRIRISVFYANDSWQQFVSDFLRPFVSKHTQNGNIGAIYIALNNDQGDNIRFAFECNAADKDQFGDELHIQLSNYLALKPSGQPPENYVGKDFFMNFPNNSIQYNLYEPDFTNNDVKKLSSLISERIMKVLAEDGYGDSFTFTFLLYIIMTFYCAHETVYGDADNLKITSMLYGDEAANKAPDTSFEVYNDLFTENEEIIKNMYLEVIDGQDEDGSVTDLEQLKAHYSLMLTGFDKSETVEHTMLLSFDRVIADQVNMNHDLLPFIYYVVYLASMGSFTDQ